MKKLHVLLLLTFLLNVSSTLAHCPLCTLGAAAVAGTALIFGVKIATIGVFLGVFASSMGWWLGNVIKKRFVPLQKPLLITFSFLTTIFPLKTFFTNKKAIYISWIGKYGTTLTLDMFLLGAIIGLVIVSITPNLSKLITKVRGKRLPFQGTFLTLLLTITLGLILQILT